MQDITIAIDGYSSTGKSTLAKELAKALGYAYVDSGAMYRAVSLYALQRGIAANGELNRELLITALKDIEVNFRHNKDSGLSEVYLNGENVEDQIRTLEVSGVVSKVAALGAVREKLVALQKELGKGGGVVMDGRDIGTVVLPDADLKIFMTASSEVRAERRYLELIARGDKVERAQVLQNVRERDHIDTNRAHSPLRKAKDAVELDNSNMDRDAQFKWVYQLAKDTIAAKN